MGTVLNEETKIVLRGEKNAAIINALVKLYELSPERATDIFYRSETAEMIEEGVADLHCRSNKYLATLVMEEYKENIN